MARGVGRRSGGRARQVALPGMPPPGGRRKPSLQIVAATISRRSFLARTLGWVTGAIALSLGIPGASAVLAPVFRKARRQWSPVGRIDKAEGGEPDLTLVGKPVLTSFTSLVQDAYLKAEPRQVAVYVVNWGDGKFSVYDVRCTHLGCPVTWEEKNERFYSPCHGGVFDAEGRVQAGPPPRPLDRYEYQIEKGVLYAGVLYRVNEQGQRVTS